jgi:hypothetical protein
MKMPASAAALAAIALMGCASQLPSHFSAIQAGDSQLSCGEIEKEIAVTARVIADAESMLARAQTTTGILGAVSELAAGIFSGDLEDFGDYAAVGGGVQLANMIAEFLASPSMQKAADLRANAVERKALLVERYRYTC